MNYAFGLELNLFFINLTLNPEPLNVEPEQLQSFFIQIIQKLPEPAWVIKKYINEKQRGQWQEKY